MNTRPVRVLALMEGTTVTGPAKNLFAFARKTANRDGQKAEVQLATFLRGDENALIETARKNGLNPLVIRETRAFDHSILQQLRHGVEDRQPDIIQSHNLKSHFLVRLLQLYQPRPWIAFHHGYVATDRKVHLYNQLDRWSLQRPDRLVTVCQPFADQLTNIGVPNGSIDVIHNMIQPFERPDESEIEQVRESAGVLPHDFVFLAAGRLSKEKGHIELVEAAGRLFKEPDCSQFRILIAGDGPERPVIEQRARELGISDRIRLLGHQPLVAPLYALAQAMVLPSHSEGSPNVLLEAMAAGIPSIATRVGGVPEIATDEENALLVPKRDADALAHAMLRLIQDHELRSRLARAGPDVTSRFTPDAYCDRVLRLYGDVQAARALRP